LFPTLIWSRFKNGLRLSPIFHKVINKVLPTINIMEENPTMLFVVAAALTLNNGGILLQRRPSGKPMEGLWEFPGGKVEAGELPKNALIRELAEELGIVVDARDLIPCTFASEDLGARHLVLLLYRCSRWAGEVRGVDGQELRWVGFDEMRQLPMPPADAPFIDILAQMAGE
jgi:8-oxo-dGTP diphosphatase